ncbi:MAG: preprotein translocase subunit SecE [Chlamydiae bacterium]|nr:preprotein translocase subunit SecE [Chlamydiota bacterium]
METNDAQDVEVVQEKLNFIESMKREVKKISWPSKSEIFQSTKIVIGSTFFLGFSVYIVDLFVKGVLDSTARIIKMLFQ